MVAHSCAVPWGIGSGVGSRRLYDFADRNPALRLAEPDRLLPAAIELAHEILGGALLSVRAARETVMLATEMGRSAALQAARAASERCYHSEDAQEGPAAFATHRPTVWKGR